MTQPSVVAVYGIPAGERLPVRLGSGSLEDERVVVLDRELSRELASDHPPVLLRVGIAGLVRGEPHVEVIEVRQVSGSERRPEWAVELWERARSPTVQEVASRGPDGPDDGPMNPVCFAYPKFSFC